MKAFFCVVFTEVVRVGPFSLSVDYQPIDSDGFTVVVMAFGDL